MISSVDGRIDCAMVDKISGDEYYAALKQLDCPSTLTGRVTMEHYSAEKEPFRPSHPETAGKASFHKAIEAEAYTVAIDTLPPVVTPVNPRSWGRTGRIVLKAKDRETGIRSYRGTIDGRYALFGKPNSISGNLVCEVPHARIRRGGRHVLEMTVIDLCGNRTTERYHFTW